MAITFAIRRILIRLEKTDNENKPFTEGERNARTRNKTIEAAQALRIVFA